MSIVKARRQRRGNYQTEYQKIREERRWAARSGAVNSSAGDDSGSEFKTSRPFVAKYNAGHCKACLKPVKRGQGVRYVDDRLMHGACLAEFDRSAQSVTSRVTT